MNRSAGTRTAPTVVVNTDSLGYVTFAGYDGTMYNSNACVMQILANENWTSIANGTRFDLYITPNGTTTNIKIASFNSDGTGLTTIGRSLAVGTNGNGSSFGLILGGSSTPISSATTPGSTGQITWDVNTLYLCTSGGIAGSATWNNILLNLGTTTQSANKVWAGPTSGAAAAPTFRSLVAADIPSLSYLLLTGGTLSGNLTLSSTLTDGSSTVGTNGQVLSSTVTGVKWVTLGSGSGTVTNTLGSLTQYAVVIGNGGNDATVIGSLAHLDKSLLAEEQEWPHLG